MNESKKPKKKGRPPLLLKKVPKTISLDEKLINEAKELGVKLSPACEDGLARAVRKARSKDA